MALSDIYQKASIALIPSGYKASGAKLYSVVPNNGDGDFTVSSDADATRVNKDGLIESVSANQARLNYDPSSPQDPHLLLEPTRTNNASRSETPQDGSWSDPLGEWTLLTETTTSPRGDQTRVFDLEDSSGTLIRCQDFSIAAGTYTVSFYIKDIGGNLTGGFVDIGDEGLGDTTPSLSTVGSEWVRVSRTITTTSTKLFLDIQPSFTGSTNKVGIWGLQLEAGSYPTSYIQTTGIAAVTRTADSVQINDFANAPTDYPFTIFCDFDLVKTGQKSFMFSFLWLASSSNYFAVGYNVDGGGNFFKFENRAQGTVLGVKTTSTYTEGRYKLAIKFVSSTNFKAFIDGLEVADHTHTAVSFNSAIKDFLLGQLRVVSDTGDRTPIHQFMVFNEALSDSELQTLTS